MAMAQTFTTLQVLTALKQVAGDVSNLYRKVKLGLRTLICHFA